MSEQIKSKGKWGWAKAVVAGLIIGGSVGTGAYFIYTNLIADKVKLIEYGKPVEKMVFDELPIKIHETNPGAAEEDRTYFLSDEGMKKLKNKIETKLNIGPEFYDLHSISIDDDNAIGDDANGNYYPKFDTINLSSKQYRTEGLPALKKGDKEAPGIEDVKVELLFQVLFHEYGHFIANKYLNIDSSNALYTIGMNGKTPWNKDFLTSFENIMGYDRPTNPKDQHYNDLKYKPKLSIVPGQSWQSMGAIYSASDIYQRVNYGNNKFPEMTDKGWIPIWAGKNPFFDTKSITKGAEADKLKYLWSMDEIYTRKYEQVLYPLSSSDIGAQSNFVRADSFHYYNLPNGRQSNNITTYAYDTSIYKDLGISGNDYMEDNPIGHTIELKELMNRHEGRDEDISTVLYDRDGNFRIGGYTEQQEFTLSINGNKIKTKVDEVPYLEEKNIKKYMWISDPIDADSIVGKQIFKVEKDKNENEVLEPITKGRHGADGIPTTNRRFIWHNQFHLSYNDNNGNPIVTIEKGAGV